MKLGNQILMARKKKQLTQEQLGEQVHVTRQTISNWELNETMPDASQLVALSKALDSSIDALVGNDCYTTLEQKVTHVDERVTKNNHLMKVILGMSICIVMLILAFILAA